jgi:uncharacterized membrane protein YcaP (DUF421 family)
MTVVATVHAITGHTVLVQSIKTAIIVVLLVVGFRLLGKREAAQMNVYDLVMLMALANAVQNGMTSGLGNLPIGLACSATVVLVAFVATRILRAHKGLERDIVGVPTLLIHQGQVLRDRLRREQVTDADLLEACRQHGVSGPNDVAMAVLEVDGSISVIPKTAMA